MKDANPNFEDGYIKLWRSFFDHEIWKTKPTAWGRVALIVMKSANYRPSTWFDGQKNILIPAGSFVASLQKLGDSARCTREQVRKSLRYLQETRFITQPRTSPYRIICITNWPIYQGGTYDENIPLSTVQNTPENTPRTPPEHLKNTPETPSKEYKKGRREEVLPLIPPFETPEPELREAWDLTPSENGKSIEKLIEYYAQKIFGRHKRKRGFTLAMTTARLRTICTKMSYAKAEQTLKQIDSGHEIWCVSEDWTKEGGEYQRGLDAFLNKRARRWGVLPDAEETVEDPGDLPEYQDPYGDEK